MKTKDEALQQVKANNKDEYLNLYGFAVDWVRIRMRPFTSEDLKIAYEELNGPPKQVNIYGAVMNALSHDKIIRHNNIVSAKLPAAHGRLIHQWISLTYSEKQASNRRKPDNSFNLFDMNL